ncbi:hypothetical protein [Candidatus Electronema sp. JM]|uniref:hypothetical protein n=1 Tax=Candidatus Electronema sp. JM TaxID=3401571 RepID=UPI003AA93678
MIKENTEAISCYAACLQLKDSERIKEKFIKPIVERFFVARSISINNCKEIDSNSEISDKDFNKHGVDYFYEKIFDDIKKTKEGKIDFSVKYCITLDKTNCGKTCDKTGIRYDEILLNTQPVFYFIYISIEEIFSFLREESS